MDTKGLGQAMIMSFLAFGEQMGAEKLDRAGERLRGALTDPRVRPEAALLIESILVGIDRTKATAA